jgi:hypothetical protein
MKTIILLIVSLAAGIGMFALIAKKYGSDCVP